MEEIHFDGGCYRFEESGLAGLLLLLLLIVVVCRCAILGRSTVVWVEVKLHVCLSSSRLCLQCWQRLIWRLILFRPIDCSSCSSRT